MDNRRSLCFEQLEQRELLSVSANAHANHLATIDEYTGVLAHTQLNGFAKQSGVLLPTGRHLLVAAHSVGIPQRSVITGPGPNDQVQTISHPGLFTSRIVNR